MEALDAKIEKAQAQVSRTKKQYDAVVAVMNCGIDEGSNERLINTVLTKAFEEETTDEK